MLPSKVSVMPAPGFADYGRAALDGQYVRAADPAI